MEMIQINKTAISGETELYSLQLLLKNSGLNMSDKFFMQINPSARCFEDGVDYVEQDGKIFLTYNAAYSIVSGFAEVDAENDAVLDRHWNSEYITIDEVYEVMTGRKLAEQDKDEFLSYLGDFSNNGVNIVDKEVRFSRSILFDVLPEEYHTYETGLIGTANYFINKITELANLTKAELILENIGGASRLEKTIPSKFSSLLYTVLHANLQRYHELTSEANKKSFFVCNFNTLLPNYSIISENTPNNVRADLWVKNQEGHRLPVEIKKGEFNAAALRQLQRYIDESESVGGIAVGECLTVELPVNIQFVSITKTMVLDAILKAGM